MTSTRGTAARTARPRQLARGGRAVAVAATAGLALAGCGGGGEGPSSEESPKGALDTFFEQMWGDYDPEEQNAQQMRIEELKAECMADEGFEYIPVDWSRGVVSEPLPAEDEIPWGTLEFAEQYGYGITTNPWEDSEQPLEPIDPGIEDPNMAIVDAMSESEQMAYWEALYGPQTEEPMPEDGEWVPPSWEDMGCSGWAEHEVYGDAAYGGGEDDPFLELQEDMNRMWESMQNDERITAANAAWADCMADAGEPGYAKVGEAEEQFWTRTDEIRNEVWEGLGPEAGEDAWMAAEEEIQRRLAELSEEEIALAVTDFTCRDDVGFTEAQTEVNLEYQQEFYDANKAELERWAEYQNGGVAG